MQKVKNFSNRDLKLLLVFLYNKKKASKAYFLSEKRFQPVILSPAEGFEKTCLNDKEASPLDVKSCRSTKMVDNSIANARGARAALLNNRNVDNYGIGVNAAHNAQRA